MNGGDRTFVVRGQEVPADLRAWEPATRRFGSLLAIGVASFLVLLGILLYVLFPGAAWVIWLLVVLVLVVLVFEAGVVVTGIQQEQAEVVEEPEETAEVVRSSPEPQRPVGDLPILTLQCSECGTVFDVEDTGERPLAHACPGCGAEGLLEEPPVAGTPSEPETLPDREEAPPAPAEEPPARKVKLQCSGCGTVFVVVDTGARPLRHSCPGCGKEGSLE